MSVDSGVPPAAAELKPWLLIGVAALASLRLVKFKTLKLNRGVPKDELRRSLKVAALDIY